MNFDDNAEEATFRAEARAWLDANVPRHLESRLIEAGAKDVSNVHLPDFDGEDPYPYCKDWQARKYASGWACVTWPKEYGGRGASPMEGVIWGQEEGIYAQLSHVFYTGHGMAGSTIMAHGTPEQKERYLRPMAAGEELWCQMFSEPSGGSDLAGLRTRAVQTREGDWIIDGQKIWNTHAQIADYGILILRTDPSVPKHAGLTMFILDLKLPGVTVRPIKQMNGHSSFNEVFLSGVRVPDSARIGAVNDGWRVALTTLMNERLLLGGSPSTGIEDLIELCLHLDTGAGLAIDDPAVRAKIALWTAQSYGLEYAMKRAQSALSHGHLPGPEYSIGKLVSHEMVQSIADYALDLLGPVGALVDESEKYTFLMSKLLVSPAGRVGGGSTEIQRNIIGERVLGLPAGPRHDKDIPFNEKSAPARPSPRIHSKVEQVG
jgi:acyl-CoA dehydrogenase